MKFLVFAPIYSLFRGLKVLLSKCTINNKWKHAHFSPDELADSLDFIFKVYHLKWYIITLVLNCKSLYPVKDEQLLRTAANGQTEVNLRTLAVRELDPDGVFFIFIILIFFLNLMSFTSEIFLLHFSTSANEGGD